MLVHGANLKQKENHRTKYLDSESRIYLTEIRKKYDEWHQTNVELSGPKLVSNDTNKDNQIIEQRVKLSVN